MYALHILNLSYRFLPLIPETASRYACGLLEDNIPGIDMDSVRILKNGTALVVCKVQV